VIYDTPGKKTVTLTVTDDEGNQASATCFVAVSPPVALPGSDQTVALNTTVDEDGVSTSSVTVHFDGSASYDPGDENIPGKGITAWKWDFPGGDPVSETAATASTTYDTPGEKKVSLTVTDNDTPALQTTATLKVTVVKLTLTASGTPTRGESATYTAAIQPSGLSPTFNWKFTGSGGEVSENTGSTNTWSGVMVVGGTIEVKATVRGKVFTETMSVTVNDRGWETDIPLTIDATGWGEPNPTEAHQLGYTSANFNDPQNNYHPDIINSGPNEGFKFVITYTLRAPVLITINKHFSMDNPPQSWVDFKNAQGNAPNEVQYADIEPAVRKHEGVGPSDLITASHYKYWHVDAVKKGTADDPATKLEKLVKPPSTSLENYKAYVVSELRSYIQAVNDRWNNDQEEPGNYLSGKSIDWSYPD
jgi:PKD repeat protein